MNIKMKEMEYCVRATRQQMTETPSSCEFNFEHADVLRTPEFLSPSSDIISNFTMKPEALTSSCSRL